MQRISLSSIVPHRRLRVRGAHAASAVCILLAIGVPHAILALAQETQDTSTTLLASPQVPPVGSPHSHRTQQFLRGRHSPSDTTAAAAMATARGAQIARALDRTTFTQHLHPLASTTTTGLSATWQPLGPRGIASLAYGTVTGRVTSLALDPADPSGNTVYVGTTGGGVWKSTDAAGPVAAVTFTPLTDTLPVFSNNAGSAAVPSLSIGALSISPTGVLLAGTGDPNDATDSYYGSGLLRSQDGGLTWTLTQMSQDGVAGTHSWVGLSFAGFAWSTAAPNVVVAALTQAVEGDLTNASVAATRGLYYSLDAGVTWQMSTILDGTQTVQTPLPLGENLGGNAVTSVAWNPVRRMFYAAVRFHGYYGSSDGITWQRLAHQPATSLSLSACPTNPGAIGLPSCPIFRGTLAAQPVTGDMFALTTDINNLDQGLWQDACASTSGACASATVSFSNRLPSSALEVGGGSTAIAQADYNQTLAAMPTTTGGIAGTTLLVGTVDLYRCSLSAGVCALRNTTNASNGCAAPAKVAPAQHALAFAGPVAPGLLFLGNDGGLWRSTDGVAQTGSACSASDSSHFDNLNAALGSLAETVSLAEDPGHPDIVLAGFGALGTATTSAATSNSGTWAQLSAGEGGFAAISPADPSQWTISTGAGVSLQHCSSGAVCTASDFAGPPAIGPAQTGNDSSLFDVPWILDPAQPGNVLLGTCRVWRGPVASGASWSSTNAVSPPLAAMATHACTGASSMIRSLAAAAPAGTATSAAGSPVLYAGMAGTQDGGGSDGGHLFSTTTGGVGTGAWTDLARNSVTNAAATGGVFNPAGFDLSSVAVDPHDATGGTVYVTVMGFSSAAASSPHVYRSTNAGASWINITRNLPNAPANSIVVDPNDANTVYVALDSGVYVTTSVTTCATANCWSVFGSGLPNAPVTQLEAGAAIATGDGRVGELRAGTYGRGIWQAPLLTASYPAQPVITLAPVSLTFTSQASGTASAAQTVTVTNTGNATLNLSRLALTGDFAETDTCAGATLAIHASCTAQVTFLPVATGARTGVLTIYGNVSGGQATVSLNGTGTTAASVVLTPLFLTFPSTTIGSTASAPYVTVSNTGGQSTTLETPTVTGDFAVKQSTCSASLPSQTGCTLVIIFTPTASGTRTGTLTIVTGAGTLTASLTGIGTAPATDALAPLSLSFRPQLLGTASAAQTVTLTNSGDVALTLINAQITSGDFSAINTCGNSLSGHSTCTISVVYQPKNVGAETGVLVVADQYRTQNVALNGTGLAPAGVSLTPTSGVSFPATAIGSSSSSQTVTLTNNGDLPLSITSLGSSGDFGMIAGSTCGTSLAAKSACTMQLVFTPTVGGARTGTLTVVSSAPNSPQTIPLSGSGVDFSLTPNGATSETVTSGQIAGFPMVLSSAAGVPGSATLTCLGMPASTTCTMSPSSADLGASTQIVVNVATGVATSAAARVPAKPFRGGSQIALGIIPLGALLARRRARRTLLPLVCMLMTVGTLALAGCGSGRAIPSDGSGSGGTGGATGTTAAGTYTITVSAVSAGLTRSVQLSLTVQ